MSALAKVEYFGRSAVQGMRRAPFVHAIAVLTVSISLFAMGLTRSADLWLHRLIDTLGGEVEMTAYVSDQVTLDEAPALALVIGQRLDAKTHVVSPEEALERLRRELGDAGEVLEALPDNPLATSIEIAVPPNLRSPAKLAEVAKSLRAMPQISAVDYGAEAVSRLSAISRALRYGAAVAFALVLAISVVVVAATLQLAIYARRDELEIQKLVGATDTFVKAPFLLEGLLQGLLGWLVAVLGLAGFFHWVGPKLAALFSFTALPQVAGGGLSGSLTVELLAAGATLGLVGSFIALGRFTRV
jgi:cell division transport system permease protein